MLFYIKLLLFDVLGFVPFATAGVDGFKRFLCFLFFFSCVHLKALLCGGGVKLSMMLSLICFVSLLLVLLLPSIA